MSSMMLPSAEWISAASRQAARPGNARSSAPRDINSPSPDSDSPQTMAPAMAGTTTAAAATGANAVDVRIAGDVCEHETFVGHRGSGGLVTGKAVFCLPPNVEWFQGHFAYAARGGCTASLGVLGTELPVDPCMRCCFGGFSRYKLVFIHYESGKESALVVERYGGNMMSLQAEASDGDEGGSAEGPNSELAFQTHVMKADDDARELLDRYFQSVVRAAPDPEDLRECIVCIGQMDVPLSLLQELAAPLPDGARTQFMVCSAFVPCREAPQHHYQQQHNQHQHQSRAQQRSTNEPTPDLSPCPRRRASRAVTLRDGEEYEGCLGSAGGDVACRPRDRVAGGDACRDEEDPRGEGNGGYPGNEGTGERGVCRRQGRGDESDDDWL